MSTGTEFTRAATPPVHRLSHFDIWWDMHTNDSPKPCRVGGSQLTTGHSTSQLALPIIEDFVGFLKWLYQKGHISGSIYISINYKIVNSTLRLSSLKNLPTFQSCVPVLTWKANLKRKVFKKIKCRQNLKLWIQINYKTNFHSFFFLGYFFVNSLKIAATKVQINYLKFSCFYMFVLGKWFISSSLNSSNFSIPPSYSF